MLKFTSISCHEILSNFYNTPMDSILEDKELKRKHVDLQKRFPIYNVYPKCLAALLCGAAIRMKASTSLQRSDVQGISLVDW